MRINTTEYADGTALVQEAPFGFYRAGRALCPDGRVRTLKRISTTADTFYSVPAAVTVKGRTVSGYILIETREGLSTPTDDDPLVVKFRPYVDRKNAHLLKGEQS